MFVVKKILPLATDGDMVIEFDGGSPLTKLLFQLFHERYTVLLTDEQVALLRAELGAILEYRKFSKKEG